MTARCDGAEVFLRSNYYPACTAELTPEGAQALRAFVHLVSAFAHAGDEGRESVLAALRATALCLPRRQRWLAREAIASVLSFGDRHLLWSRVAQDGAGPEDCEDCGALLENDGSTPWCPVCAPGGQTEGAL
ncbi:uncharacterized protein SOCE26_052660 [Sorangium cellulosum]|uniref:Uncharacterized protein n=1 Tax=Sorangium cellulosum TaxID=56 RepID=A0A2L0EWY0_SORCE|nr:hypothetical protein [Sorangium cellulosum]AUX43811.1 uncharacterized protein SOCE26_052660 [Sorangium cellulosum]